MNRIAGGGDAQFVLVKTPRVATGGLGQRHRTGCHIDVTIRRVILPRIVRDLVDFVYPGRCAGCGADCQGAEVLCHSCAAGLENIAAAPARPRCAAPVVSEGAACPWCRGSGLYPYQGVMRLGRFDDPLRQLIHAMKYHRRWALGRRIAQRLLEEDRVQELLAGADALVPVPLHWVRQIGRGYNQAEILASALARRRGLKLIRPLKRIRPTASQTTIHSRTVREENVRGAFALARPKSVAGLRVVVVDDVMTTGATLQAVGRALLAGRPASLHALVLAVADPRGRDFQAV